MAAASSNWLAEDKRLMLHAVYRVGDLDKTEVCTDHCRSTQNFVVLPGRPVLALQSLAQML
jgi:hypothetical protein